MFSEGPSPDMLEAIFGVRAACLKFGAACLEFHALLHAACLELLVAGLERRECLLALVQLERHPSVLDCLGLEPCATLLSDEYEGCVTEGGDARGRCMA